MAALARQYCRQFDERPVERDLRRALTEYLGFAGRRGEETDFVEYANELRQLLADDAGLRWEFWLPARKLPDVLVYGRGWGRPSDDNVFLVLGTGVALRDPSVKGYAQASETMRKVLRYMGHSRGRTSTATLRERESNTRKRLRELLGAPHWDRTFDKLHAQGNRLLRSNPSVTLPGPRIRP
jgi:hypothetical protein